MPTIDTRPVPAATVRHLMRTHRVTIAEVACAVDLTLAEVRRARTVGGAWDWPLICEVTAQKRAAGTLTASPRLRKALERVHARRAAA